MVVRTLDTLLWLVIVGCLTYAVPFAGICALVFGVALAVKERLS